MGIKSSHIFNNKEKNEKSKKNKKSLNIKNIELIHEIQEKYKIDPMIILKKELSLKVLVLIKMIIQLIK